MVVGRDLIRAMQDVAKIPEIETIWKELLNNPTSLSPKVTSYLDILRTPTPKMYLQSRVTPDMETFLLFILCEVSIVLQLLCLLINTR